jgi:hypothetical protein
VLLCFSLEVVAETSYTQQPAACVGGRVFWFCVWAALHAGCGDFRTQCSLAMSNAIFLLSPLFISWSKFGVVFVFLVVVVVKNRLYTTTTSRVCGRLCFGFCIGTALQTGCEANHKQNNKIF